MMEDLLCGACLPKDSDALVKYANQIEKQLNLLNNAIKLNNDIRSDYNKETDRELEQNITFRGEKKIISPWWNW